MILHNLIFINCLLILDKSDLDSPQWVIRLWPEVFQLSPGLSDGGGAGGSSAADGGQQHALWLERTAVRLSAAPPPHHHTQVEATLRSGG